MISASRSDNWKPDKSGKKYHFFKKRKTWQLLVSWNMRILVISTKQVGNIFILCLFFYLEPSETNEFYRSLVTVMSWILNWDSILVSSWFRIAKNCIWRASIRRHVSTFLCYFPSFRASSAKFTQHFLWHYTYVTVLIHILSVIPEDDSNCFISM